MIQSKKLSCGIIFVNEKSEILMIHSSTHHHWDIPKGTKNINESEINAAIRETEEETGIKISPSELKDLSWFEYNNYKDLWLFIAKMPDIDINELVCTSFMINDYGKEIPEADSFEMIHIDKIEERACYSMKKVLDSGGLLRDIKNFIKNDFK